VEAFRRIARARVPFIVNNGASQKYLADVLLETADKPDRAGWYRDKGLRNQATTKDAIDAAVKDKGYTLWGLVPFLKYREEHSESGMKALVTDDPLFQRLMVTVVVKPEKIRGVNIEGAKALERFLIAPETQARIRRFRVLGFDGPVWWPAGRNNSGAFLKGGPSFPRDWAHVCGIQLNRLLTLEQGHASVMVEAPEATKDKPFADTGDSAD
jgi:ABC-type tungstate transport system permease subunit